MRQRVGVLGGLLVGALLAFPPALAVCQTSTGAPTQADFERGLKMRGLPSLGTSPAPQGPNPAVEQANIPGSAPPSAYSPPTAAASPSMILNTITFKFGSAELEPQSVVSLRNLGNALNQGLKDEKMFIIEGHTDQAGSLVFNEALSRQRAEAVKSFLVNEMGVSANRLQAVGKGFSEPANPRDPFAGENRRVVVINTGSS